MKKIAFDVMGNDNGPQAAIIAVMKFINLNDNYFIYLVGDESIINKYLIPHPRIEIINNINVVNKDGSLRNAYSENNSMTQTLHLLKDGKVDACLSSGDSAKLMASSIFIIKRIEGIIRPAFMPIFPTIIKDKKFIMLDVGANLDINSDHLVQWAKLGSIFSRKVLKINNPKVYILNIGTEENKGFPEHQKADKELKLMTKNNELNYKGFIEPRDLLEGNADVVVSDGYAGNITLKSMEGTIINFQKLIKKHLTANIFRKINVLFLKSAFNDIKEDLDYRNVGAAWIIGINGIVIKSHGSADEKSYCGALQQLKQAIDSNALIEIKKEL